MKKFLLSLLAVAACFSYATATDVSFADGLPSDWTKIDGNVAKQTRVNTACLQLQKGATITSPEYSNVSEITLSLNISANASTLKVELSTDGGTNWTTIKTVNKADCSTSAWTPITITTTPAENMQFKLTSASASYYISTFSYTSSSSKTPNGLEWSDKAATATLGQAFSAPTLTNPNSLAVTYASSNKEVATISAEGSITLVGAGNTEISATFAGNDTYEGGSAQYTLEVIDPNALDVTYDFVKNTYGLERNSSNSYETSISLNNGVVTLTGTKLNGNGFRLWTDGLRVYKSSNGIAVNISFSAEGYVITGIEMTVKDVFKTVTVDDATVTATQKVYNWTGKAKQPVMAITTTENIAITSIKVNYEKAAAPAVPGVTANDEVLTESSINLTEGNPVTIKFTVPEGVAVWYKFDAATQSDEPAAQDEDGYAEYNAETGIRLTEAGTLSYYAEQNGLKSDVQKLTVTGSTTSIREIGVEGGAEWFDLQGRRVAAPAHGIFIRRAGNTVSKVRL